jgi:hypothetical protein
VPERGWVEQLPKGVEASPRLRLLIIEQIPAVVAHVRVPPLADHPSGPLFRTAPRDVQPLADGDRLGHEVRVRGEKTENVGHLGRMRQHIVDGQHAAGPQDPRSRRRRSGSAASCATPRSKRSDSRVRRSASTAAFSYGGGALLDRFCAEIGRDPAAITRSIVLPVSYDQPGDTCDAVGKAIDAGFRHIIFILSPPYPANVAAWVADRLITTSVLPG